eukprot:m.71133 g.71133  ORF g.71133 m.71133 type:complete len:82 (-) comp12215_c0_seq2:3454-3699(-)
MLSLAPARHALLRAFSPPVFRFVHGMKLEYSGHGEPEDVLRVTSFPLTTKLEKDQVMVSLTISSEYLVWKWVAGSNGSGSC